MNEETRLKKAHVALMKHPETALYSGVILMGENSIIEEKTTAYTDGRNKKYSREFVSKLTDQELRGLIMHENLHVALKHIPRFKKEFKAEPMLVNASADYVVNDIIMNLKDRSFCSLPSGGLYDAKYHNWSVREVYNDLKKQQEEDKKSGKSITKYDTLDEHDFESAEGMSEEDTKELEGKIDRALREGGILAGRMGSKMPRSIEDLLTPKVNWRDVLKEFISSSMRGADEYTWRRFNKRLMVNDLYMPSLENETVGELVVAIDTSGSIGSAEITEFASELVSICDVVTPSQVRVLWWDTEVHGEQIFTPSNYAHIKELLKPQGGGGTEVSCVSRYINEKKIQAEATIVFTDGYLESDIQWNIQSPTLWLVTQARDFIPPVGKVIRKED
jgi:predicted metal-dependent peptidase